MFGIVISPPCTVIFQISYEVSISMLPAQQIGSKGWLSRCSFSVGWSLRLQKEKREKKAILSHNLNETHHPSSPTLFFGATLLFPFTSRLFPISSQ